MTLNDINIVLFLHPRNSHRYPRNNDPVSCTELGMLSKLSEEFDERNCKLVAIGVDSKIGHRNFIKEVQVEGTTQRPSNHHRRITSMKYARHGARRAADQ